MNGHFLIQTLGCKLNQLESEAAADAFIQAGFRQLTINSEKLNETGAECPPDVAVINTCTVTSKADQKARRVIRKMLRDYPDSCVIVTGCYAQLNRNDLLGLDTGKKRRLFVVNKDKLPEIINSLDTQHSALEILSALLTERLTSNASRAPGAPFAFNPKRFTRHTRSFLKIQDGCDKNCAYCRVRLARGPSISLDSREVLSRLKILEKTHAEAVLTGVNICQYRDNTLSNNEQITERGLTELLEYLLDGTEKICLRLSSLEPDYIDDKLLNILTNKRIRPHFHLSIQSGSGFILNKMGRLYNGKTVENAVNLLRSAKEDPFLACDIIAGFPGETDTEFAETLNICKEMDFAWIHVFPYSKRPGTSAFSFNGAVRENEITERVKILNDLAFLGRERYVKRSLGREVDALVEMGTAYGEECEARYCRGISENYLKLRIRYQGENAPAAGTVLRCKLLETGNFDDYDAVGEAI